MTNPPYGSGGTEHQGAHTQWIHFEGRAYAIALEVGDVLTHRSDALALKYAQGFHGVDLIAADALWGVRIDFPDPDLSLPGVGDVRVYPTNDRFASRDLIFVGTAPVYRFEYADVRDFALRAVRAASRVEGCHELSMTLHGMNNGLDEGESFTAQLAGLLDSIRRGDWSPDLRTVTIVETDGGRVERLRALMRSVLPPKVMYQLPTARLNEGKTARDGVDSAGEGSRKKPHVFVAMSFDKNLDDLFHYGIRAAIAKAGFLCERVDLQKFTGDIVERTKERIGSASLVVAEVTGANPNVYLEIGYAWGRNVRTLLLAREVDELRFDIQSQRCLIYHSIHDLEVQLHNELRGLDVR
jgi:hypothetical protein